MAQVKIYTEETTNLSIFDGLPLLDQPARLVVAEAHPTDANAIRLYRTDREDTTVFLLKTQSISEILDVDDQFLVADRGMDRSAVLTYLNDTVFAVADHDLITSFSGPTTAGVAPADYTLVVVDSATGEVKVIPDYDYITPEEATNPGDAVPDGTLATQEWVTQQLADYFQTEGS